MAINYRYMAFVDTKVSYVAHLPCYVVGLLLDIVILRNHVKQKLDADPVVVLPPPLFLTAII